MKNTDSIWREQKPVSGEEVKRRKADIYIETTTNSKRIDSLIQQNSPINNALARDEELNNLYWEVEMPEPKEVKVREKKGKHSPIYTLCSFTYDESVDYESLNKKGRFNITGYDRRVYNAIGTLWINGKSVLTLTEIFEVMNGYGKSKPSSKQLQAIEKALHKLKNINLYIDLTAEVKANMLKDKEPLIAAGILSSNKDNIKSVIIEDSMLHYRMATITSENGKKFKSIQIMNEPSLLTYNRAKGTLLTVPMEYIGLKNTSATEKSIAFQDYLLLRIMSYKNGNMRENKILYNTIYKDSGIERPKLSKDFKRDRDIIKKLLEEWLDQGLITGYEDMKEGRSYVGIIFSINE